MKKKDFEIAIKHGMRAAFEEYFQRDYSGDVANVIRDECSEGNDSLYCHFNWEGKTPGALDIILVIGRGEEAEEIVLRTVDVFKEIVGQTCLTEPENILPVIKAMEKCLNDLRSEYLDALKAK